MSAPSGGRLGQAFVQIRADARRFAREARRSINNGLADIEDYLTRGRFPLAVRRAGAQAGRDFARMFNLFASRINIDTDRLGAFALTFSKIALAVGSAANAFATFTPAVIAAGAALGTLAGAGAAAIPALITTGLLVKQTLANAFKGVGDAMNAITEGDAAALEEALKDLTPAAAAFVREWAATAPQFKRLQKEIQESFFLPLKGGLTELAGSGIFDTLREQMKGIATDAGAAARQALRVVYGQQQTGNIAIIAAEARKQFGFISALLPNLARSLFEVAAAASPFLTQMASGLSGVVEKGLNRLVEFAKSGGIADLFERGFEILQAIGSALSDIVHIVGILFGSLLAGADGAAGPLASVLETLRAFLETEETARVLEQLGRAFQKVGDIVSGVLGALLPVVGKIVEALAGPLLRILERLERPLIRLAEDFAVLFGHVIEAAAPVLERVVDLLLQLGIDVLGLVATHIEEMTPLLTKLLEELGPHMIPVVEALVEVLRAFLPILPDLSEALLELLPAIVDLIPVMVFMSKVTAALWKGIAVLVGWVVSLLGWLVKLVASAFTKWLEFVAFMLFTAWPKALKFARDAYVWWVSTVLEWTGNLLETVGNALGNLGTWLMELPGKVKGWLAGLVVALVEPFRNAFDMVQRVVSEKIQSLMNSIQSIPGRLAGFVGSIFNAAANIGRAIGNGIANIPGFAVDIAGRIVGAIRNFANNVIYSINVGIARLDNLIPFSLPQIPYLAKGAIVDSPTLAVVGEAGAEVVIPLNNPRRAQQLAEESGLLSMLSGMGEQGVPVINVYVGNELITEKVRVEVVRVNKAQARELSYARAAA